MKIRTPDEFRREYLEGNFDAETANELNIPGWERYKGKITLPFQGQLVRGRWYVPQYGCDSLEMLLNELGFFGDEGEGG